MKEGLNTATTSTQQHIRPKVRKTKDVKQSTNKPLTTTTAAGSTSSATTTTPSLSATTNDFLVEETRQRMGKWMGVGGGESPAQAIPKPSSARDDILSDAKIIAVTSNNNNMMEKDSTKRASSILKKTPKYSNSTSSSKTKNPYSTSATTTTTTTTKKSPIILSDLVVERDPARPLPPRSTITATSTTTTAERSNSNNHHHHGAVEGYIPRSVAARGGTTSNKKPAVNFSSSSTPSPPPTSSAPASKVANNYNNHGTTSNSNNSNGDNQEDPLILSSVADLFQAAGQDLPEQGNGTTKIHEDTQLLEANISFSCMTQEQYNETLLETKQQQERERQEQYQLFLGTQNIFKQENEEKEGSRGNEENRDTNTIQIQDNHLTELEYPVTPEEDGDDHDDDDYNNEEEEDMDSLLEQGGSGEEEEDDDDYYDNDGDSFEDDEENVTSPEPRAFLKLWTTLSEWITPQAVDWVNRLSASNLESQTETSESNNYNNNGNITNWTPQVDRSDVGASRCAGLMAMIKMNIPKSLKELQRTHDVRRTAELRLADWLRTFDYSMPMAKMDLKLWRAMTCILLDIVLLPAPLTTTMTSSSAANQDDVPQQQLPESVAAVGLTQEEYRYLTRSAVQSLGNTKTPLVVSNN